YNMISTVVQKVGETSYLAPFGQKQFHEYLEEWRQARKWLAQRSKNQRGHPLAAPCQVGKASSCITN
ncbi:MAG: hypothetical protein ABIP64_14020, partial [Burkholderiales bacterium]